jgi:hypothetical protein
MRGINNPTPARESTRGHRLLFRAGRRLVLFFMINVVFLAFLPSGVPAFDAEFVITILDRQIDRNANAQTIWNVGFHLFNEYGPTPQNAEALSEAYSQVRSNNRQNELVFKKAAHYWRLKVLHWNRPIPRDVNNRVRLDESWRYPTDWNNTLRMFPSGDQRFRSSTHFTTRSEPGGNPGLPMYRYRD